MAKWLTGDIFWMTSSDTNFMAHIYNLLGVRIEARSSGDLLISRPGAAEHLQSLDTHTNDADSGV
jgi:hypothetical protein